MKFKQDLNLAALHEDHEEIADSEMKVVSAGLNDCDCPMTNISTDSVMTEDIRECSCGSIWVVFGLTYG